MLTGRADDVLLLVNGEKASPAPLEASLRAQANIADALVFGANRAVLGVAIVPASADFKKEELEQAIAKANKLAPAHAQISPELLLLLHVGTEFPRASKGSLQRGRAYEAFATQIEAVYTKYGKSDADTVGKSKMKLEGQQLLDFITKIVQETMRVDSVEKDDDLFSSGLNSIQSVRIRNLLQKVSLEFLAIRTVRSFRYRSLISALKGSYQRMWSLKQPRYRGMLCQIQKGELANAVIRLAEYIEGMRQGSSTEGSDADLELMRKLANDPKLADFTPFDASKSSAAHPNGTHGAPTYVSCML